MKFIESLSNEEKLTLHEAYRRHPLFRVRERAQAVLLNARGYTIARLHEFFDVRRETVSSWLQHWERDGVMGLFDPPRSGRPPIFTLEESEQFIRDIDDNPHQRKAAAARLQERTGKEASSDTFKRILKKKTIVGSGVGSR